MARKKYPATHPKYWPTRIGLRVLNLIALLPYDLNYQFGKMIGLLLYYFNKPMRRVSEINIQHCLKNKSPLEQKNIAKTSFMHLGCSFTDAVVLAFMRQTPLFDNMLHDIRGLAQLEKALQEGHGVLLLFPHLINMYMVGYLLLKKTKLPFSIMYHSPSNPVLKQFFHQRLCHYCEHVFTRKDIKPLIHYLREGKLVWYAPDLDPGRKQAVFVPFLGLEAATHTATARIAKATSAKIFFIGFHRQADKTFEVEFHPLQADFPTDNKEKDAIIINRTMEKIILKYPEQYLWQYRRFETVKEGKSSIYAQDTSKC